ncbi:hypothetical protein D8M06_12165 [Oceanobacillus halophilus]|uniref:Uncharacterized protein n=1 Tax=Oceanobacillus halophilus TaxID=930130 RepID=A0A495A078_9BACI|nr:hypothetical protein D8M06_12165 [Oceanobacillus halophilus]
MLGSYKEHQISEGNTRRLLEKRRPLFSACDVTLPRRSLSCGKKSIGETALCVSTKEAHQLPAESVVYFRSED